MKCTDCQQLIPLLAYDEIEDDERFRVQGHVRDCQPCRSIFEEHRHMHAVLAEDASAWHVPADLLAEARRGLSDQLDIITAKKPWWQVPWLTPMKLLESAALVAVGLAVGVYVQSQGLSTVPVSSPAAQVGTAGSNIVSNVRIVSADPSTGQIELAGEMIQPLRYSGKLEDDTIRELLFSALRDAGNPGYRLRAVEVLSSKPQDQTFRDALVHALMYDENPGVRLKALMGLKAFAAEPEVRMALTEALMKDSNPGIRVEAIDVLTASGGRDASLMRSLSEVARSEENQYVRNKAIVFVGGR